MAFKDSPGLPAINLLLCQRNVLNTILKAIVKNKTQCVMQKISPPPGRAGILSGLFLPARLPLQVNKAYYQEYTNSTLSQYNI